MKEVYEVSKSHGSELPRSYAFILWVWHRRCIKLCQEENQGNFLNILQESSGFSMSSVHLPYQSSLCTHSLILGNMVRPEAKQKKIRMSRENGGFRKTLKSTTWKLKDPEFSLTIGKNTWHLTSHNVDIPKLCQINGNL